MKRVRTLAARVPASLSMLVVMWTLFAVFGSRGRDVLVYGLAGEEHIASLLTAGLTSSHVAGMVYSSLALLVFAVPAEVLLTTRRFAVAAIASHAVAVPTGAVAAIIVERAGFNQWGGDLVNETYLSPAAWIFGSLAFTTSSMGVMWRRRVRLVLIALTATLVLYDGSLNAVVAFSAVLIGCAAGHLVVGAEIARRGASVRESRVLVAVLFAAVSLGPVLVAFNPAAHGPFADVSQLMWEPAVAANEVLLRCVDADSATCQEALQINQQSGLGPLLLNIAPLVASLVVALGLRRGRRLAWIFAVVSTLISLAVIFVQLVGWVDSFLLAFNVALVVLPWLVVLAVLIATRSRFCVRSQWRPALVGTLAALAVCASIWVVGAIANPGFVERASLSDVLLETPLRFMPPVIALFWPPYVIPQSSLSWLLYEWVGIAFWAAAIYFLHRALTSAPSGALESERGRAKEILMRGTGDHLAWMGLWDGNRYFFTGGGTGYVAYRISNNVAVTLGEPVFGAGTTRDEVADAFETHAAEQGWRVAWYSVSEDFARAGYRTVHVAEESLLHADNLEFKGKKFTKYPHRPQPCRQGRGYGAVDELGGAGCRDPRENLCLVRAVDVGQGAAGDGIYPRQRRRALGRRHEALTRDRRRRTPPRSDKLAARVRGRRAGRLHPRFHAPRPGRVPPHHRVPLGGGGPDRQRRGGEVGVALRRSVGANRRAGVCSRGHPRQGGGEHRAALRLSLPGGVEVQVPPDAFRLVPRLRRRTRTGFHRAGRGQLLPSHDARQRLRRGGQGVPRPAGSRRGEVASARAHASPLKCAGTAPLSSSRVSCGVASSSVLEPMSTMLP